VYFRVAGHTARESSQLSQLGLTVTKSTTHG
jgi:hypothetical protein